MRANRIDTRAVSGSTRADRDGIRVNGIYACAVLDNERANANGTQSDWDRMRAGWVSTLLGTLPISETYFRLTYFLIFPALM